MICVQVKQPKMGQMLKQLKGSLAEFAESDEVAVILKQMLQVRLSPQCSPTRGRACARASARTRALRPLLNGVVETVGGGGGCSAVSKPWGPMA